MVEETVGGTGLAPIAGGGGDGGVGLVCEGGGELAEPLGQALIAEFCVAEFSHDRDIWNVVHSQFMSQVLAIRNLKNT
jgi:hypothetical protein